MTSLDGPIPYCKMILYVLVLVVYFLVAAMVRRRQRNFAIFKDLGIPGPPPSLLWGNLPDFEKKGIGQCMQEWSEKYGEVYGIFFGYYPVLMSENREVNQSIMMKNSMNFNRMFFSEMLELEDNRMNVALTLSKGQKWKDVRGILSPTFSGSKIRKVVPTINEKVNEFMEYLETLPREEEVDFVTLYTPVMVDVAFSVFTGLQPNVLKNPSQKIVKALQGFLSAPLNDRTQLFLLSFPQVLSFMLILEKILPFRLFSTGNLTYIMSQVAHVIKRRAQMPDYSRMDLLQLIMDHNKEVEKMEGKTSKDVLKDDELTANAVDFIFAGYEASKLLVSFTIHMLIHHPDIQDKVREEILTVVGDKKDVSYDDMKNLHLMDQVLSETLRRHPPTLTSIGREADSDYEVLGKTVPKWVRFMVPLDSLHLSSKYWKDPLVFDPDRFAPEQKVDPMVYMPFGAGPRFCIGRNMALAVTKLALARLLQRYRVLPGPNTDEENLPKRDSLFIVYPKNGIYGKLVKI